MSERLRHMFERGSRGEEMFSREVSSMLTRDEDFTKAFLKEFAKESEEKLGTKDFKISRTKVPERMSEVFEARFSRDDALARSSIYEGYVESPFAFTKGEPSSHPKTPYEEIIEFERALSDVIKEEALSNKDSTKEKSNVETEAKVQRREDWGSF
ncbi:hypothetical protein THIOSC15_670008 [uncultured Thiomicrorhabdus sp.]